MDPDRQAAASEAGKILIQHPHHQHWSSSGLCSLSTQMTAPLNTPLSNSWSLQMTPHWLASFRTETSLLTDRRFSSWLSGAGLNNLELNMLKTVEMIVDFRKTPPIHHHKQHCDCSGVLQVPVHPHLSGPAVGHSHWLFYWLCSVLLYNCMVWVSQQIRYKKTAADC